MLRTLSAVNRKGKATKKTARRQKRRASVGELRLELKKTLAQLIKMDKRCADLARKRGESFDKKLLDKLEDLKVQALELEERVHRRENRNPQELGMFLTQLQN